MDRFDEEGRSPYVDPVALPFPVKVDEYPPQGRYTSATSTRISSDGADAMISNIGLAG